MAILPKTPRIFAAPRSFFIARFKLFRLTARSTLEFALAHLLLQNPTNSASATLLLAAWPHDLAIPVEDLDEVSDVMVTP
jgi:hypothetical protein